VGTPSPRCPPALQLTEHHLRVNRRRRSSPAPAPAQSAPTHIAGERISTLRLFLHLPVIDVPPTAARVRASVTINGLPDQRSLTAATFRRINDVESVVAVKAPISRRRGTMDAIHLDFSDPVAGQRIARATRTFATPVPLDGRDVVLAENTPLRRSRKANATIRSCSAGCSDHWRYNPSMA
jgi:hypothetical protein